MKPERLLLIGAAVWIWYLLQRRCPSVSSTIDYNMGSACGPGELYVNGFCVPVLY